MSDKGTDLGFAQGQIKWFSRERSFGFISLDDGREAFLHFSQIMDREDQNAKPGERVSCRLWQTAKGLQARTVHVIG